jgi:hypothetical protein
MIRTARRRPGRRRKIDSATRLSAVPVDRWYIQPPRIDEIDPRKDLGRWKWDPWREWGRIRRFKEGRWASHPSLPERGDKGSEPGPPSSDRQALAHSLAQFRGMWVALRGSVVVYSAESDIDIVMHLRSIGATADSMFRVPVDPAFDRYDDL